MSADPPRLGAGLFEIVDAERAHAPNDIYEVRSMLGYDERLLLHWATRAGNATPDAVVDAGCFLGGSTLALASGVMARPHGPRSAVHVYDLFRYGAESDRGWVPEGYDFAVGASTLPVFEHQVRRVRGMLTLHPGDVCDARWDEGPIGVLFIDIAKSWGIGDAVWRTFLPALAVDSLVIQQDLVHWGHPWCAIIMELLADHFEFLGWAWYSSAAYRCVEPIDVAELPASLLDALSTEEMLRLLDRAAQRMGEPIAGFLRLAGAVVLASHGDLRAARGRVDEVRASYSDDVRAVHR